jgi:phosphoglycerate dehydrogenase-like enzyme
VAAATDAGILVLNTPGANTIAAAEQTFALMLSIARRIPAAVQMLREGIWNRKSLVGTELFGKTLGIIGLGRIGGRVAQYGRALGMRLLAWSRNLTREAAEASGAALAGKEALLRASDVVTLHVPLAPASRGLIGAAEIALMKPGALLVNTSRAGLVDQAAMLAALHEGRIMAALDVYEREPLPPDDPIRSAPNTVLTPHLGYGSVDTFRQFYAESIQNVLAFLDGTPMRVMNSEIVAQ